MLAQTARTAPSGQPCLALTSETSHRNGDGFFSMEAIIENRAADLSGLK